METNVSSLITKLPFKSEVSIKRLHRVIGYILDSEKISLEDLLKDIFSGDLQKQILNDINFWISSEDEFKIYEILKDRINIGDAIHRSGKEFFLTDSFDLLPNDDSLLSYDYFLQRLPLMFKKYVLYVNPEIIDFDSNSLTLNISSTSNKIEKSYEYCFLKGILEGTTILFQIKNWNLRLLQTRIPDFNPGYCGQKESFESSEQSLVKIEWDEAKIKVGKTSLSNEIPDKVSQTFVISNMEKNEESEFSYIDLDEVIDKSLTLAIQNRDLEAAVEVLSSLRNELIVKQKAISKDLRMARNIQRGIIPQHIPDWKGLQFSFRYLPMQEVSGDYYDYFNFGSNKIGIVLSDVSGHGVPAAFITAISKLLFTNYKLDSPSEIFCNTNRELLDLVKQQGYLTCFYGIIDSHYELTYSIAGHPRPILLRYRTKEVELLEGEGTFLGMFADADQYYKDYRTKLEPGDKLFIYTDGLLEGETDKGVQFQQTKLIELVEKTIDMDVKSSVDFIMEEFHEFCRGTDQGDDITLLAIGVSLKMSEFLKYKSIAEKYYSEKIYHLACEYMYRAKEIFPSDMNVLFQLGKYLAKDQKFSEASKHLEEYNSLKTSNADSHLILGYCYYKMENYGKAELEFLKTISMRASNLKALFNISKVYQKQKEYGKAMDALNRILTHDPNHTVAKQSILHLTRFLEKKSSR